MAHKDVEDIQACMGCAVCVLPCPVFRSTGDLALTVRGRASAIQGGAEPEGIRDAVVACILCGACKPSCPKGVDTVAMTLSLRSQLAESGLFALADLLEKDDGSAAPKQEARSARSRRMLIPGTALRADKPLLEKTVRTLGQRRAVSVADDDGSDIVYTLEAGLPLGSDRKAAFKKSLAGAREVIVAEGLLHPFLRKWLRGVRVVGLGEAMLRESDFRSALRPTDLYVIEARGFNADHARLVMVYDRLQQEVGCAFNTDLQRTAISTGAGSLQEKLGLDFPDPVETARWIVKERAFDRVVVERVEDKVPFAVATDRPVVHVSEILPPGGAQ